MVSQFGSVGYTIMGKTADLTVVQKAIIDTLHKEGKPQTFIAKEAGCSQSSVSKHVNRRLCGRKRCTTNRENRNLMRIVKQNRFKNLGELHKEWTEAGVKASRAPHTDVSRNLATVVVRGVLAQLNEIQNLLSSVFHLETKVPESGGRVEKLIAQVAWSPVLSFHSLWWFGVQCHLLVLVRCVFLKTNVTAPVYQYFFEHFMLPSTDQLFKDADFIFQQDLVEIYGLLSRGKWETRDQKMQMSWRPLSKKPGLPYHLSSATSGVVEGIRRYTAYTHFFISQHSVYPLLNLLWCASFSSVLH